MSRRLEELNEARASAWRTVAAIGMTNIAGKSDRERLALDAQSRLANDAWARAESEYQRELRRTPTAELTALVAGITPEM